MLRFDGKVALVTGAGNGIGKAHALLLASRGAKVVVNDFGVKPDGTDPSPAAADAVVAEIVAAGGIAIADANSVATYAGGKAMIDRTLSEFGDLDIIVHNAGFVDDAPFEDIDQHRYQRLVDVHLNGGFNVVHPAWGHFQAKRSGQVVLTTSGAGFFGVKGHVVYGAAKLGLIGLMRGLALEGAAYDIRVNAIAPAAVTRASADSLDGWPGLKKLTPDLVAAAVAVLAHRDCPLTGRTISAGAGRVAELFIGATQGFFSSELTPELVFDHLDQVCDRADYAMPADALVEVNMGVERALADAPAA